jgi:hypothetical protein
MSPTKSKKSPRAREYTGPNTLEAVKEFWRSNATQKAKVQAAEALSGEDQAKLAIWAQKHTLNAFQELRQTMDAEWERRGFKKPTI